MLLAQFVERVYLPSLFYLHHPRSGRPISSRIRIPMRLLKHFPLVIRSAGRARRGFPRGALFATGFSRVAVLSTLLSSSTRSAHSREHPHSPPPLYTYILHIPFCFLSHVSPGILRISPILIQSHDFLAGNPALRNGFAQYRLLSPHLRSCDLASPRASPPRVLALSRALPRAYSIPIR